MILHDAEIRKTLVARVRAIQSGTQPKWGAMDTGQMLWHVNRGLQTCMGTLDPGDEKMPMPIPKAMFRFFVLYTPWPKGSPTVGVMKASGKHDVEAERAALLKTVDQFAAKALEGKWPVHPTLGAMSGKQYSRLSALHMNHHLKQFGG